MFFGYLKKNSVDDRKIIEKTLLPTVWENVFHLSLVVERICAMQSFAVAIHCVIFCKIYNLVSQYHVLTNDN